MSFSSKKQQKVVVCVNCKDAWVMPVSIKASLKITGFRGSIEEVALVDTGAPLTLLDRGVADKVGVEYAGEEDRVVVADGHEVKGELAVVRELVIEGRKLPYAHLAVIKFPQKLREALRRMGLSSCCIAGLTALEPLQLILGTATGRLRELPALLLHLATS